LDSQSESKFSLIILKGPGLLLISCNFKSLFQYGIIFEQIIALPLLAKAASGLKQKGFSLTNAYFL
jgi:hypothetical protein